LSADPAHDQRVEKVLENEAQEREIVKTGPAQISAFAYIDCDDRISRNFELSYHKFKVHHMDDIREALMAKRAGFETKVRRKRTKNASVI